MHNKKLSLQDGCWCCLDEAQTLGRVVMSVMLEHLEAVSNALKARQGFAIFRDAQEVLKSSCIVPLTLLDSLLIYRYCIFCIVML